MASTKLYAPSGFTGRTTFGSHVVEFVDGVAEFHGEINDGLRSYFASTGVGVGKRAPLVEDDAEVVDSRDVNHEKVGNDLRDAAVDPRPDDFLAPINAGEADPHGPMVVSPGIHALDELAVVPGAVGSLDSDGFVVSDVDAQEAKEKRFAEAVLVGDQEVPDATLDIARDEGTPEMADIDAADEADDTPDDDSDDDKPKRATTRKRTTRRRT